MYSVSASQRFQVANKPTKVQTSSRQDCLAYMRDADVCVMCAGRVCVPCREGEKKNLVQKWEMTDVLSFLNISSEAGFNVVALRLLGSAAAVEI